MHVLVVGAGLAAVSVCSGLRAGGFDGGITVVGDEEVSPYDRPALSKTFLSGERGCDAVALQPRQWYADNGIELRLGAAVAEIDADAPSATLADDSRITADVLVLATGGRPRRLTAPGAEAAQPLRTLADAGRLRDALVPDARVLIVGAGLIGAEVASTAHHRGCHVTLVDPSHLPMERALGPHAARALHAQHTAHGVTTLQAGLHAVAGNHVTLTTGATYEADVILAGIGIIPNTELAEAAGIAVENGVQVNEAMRTSAPNVYAVGDIARIAGEPHRFEHWDNARRTGEAAARGILGLPAEPPRAPWFWTDRYGTHLEMAGLYDPHAEAVPRGDIGAGSGSVFYVRDGLCVGAVSLERPLDIRAAQRLIDRRIAVVSEELADESRHLRKLLAARAG